MSMFLIQSPPWIAVKELTGTPGKEWAHKAKKRMACEYYRGMRLAQFLS